MDLEPGLLIRCEAQPAPVTGSTKLGEAGRTGLPGSAADVASVIVRLAAGGRRGHGRGSQIACVGEGGSAAVGGVTELAGGIGKYHLAVFIRFDPDGLA